MLPLHSDSPTANTDVSSERCTDDADSAAPTDQRAPVWAGAFVALLGVVALCVPAAASGDKAPKCPAYRSCVPQNCVIKSEMSAAEIAKCCQPPTPQLCAQAAMSDLKGDVYGSDAAKKGVGSGWDTNESVDTIMAKLYGTSDFQARQSGIFKACGLAPSDFRDIPELRTDCRKPDTPFSVDVGPPAGTTTFGKDATPTDFENALKKGSRSDGCPPLSGVCAEQVTFGFQHEREHFSKCSQALGSAGGASGNAARAARALFNLQDEADAYHHEARRYKHSIDDAKRSCELAKKNGPPPPGSPPPSSPPSVPPATPPPNDAPAAGDPGAGAPPAGDLPGWPIGDPPSTSGGPGAAAPKRWGNPFLSRARGDLARFHKTGEW